MVPNYNRGYREPVPPSCFAQHGERRYSRQSQIALSGQAEYAVELRTGSGAPAEHPVAR